MVFKHGNGLNSILIKYSYCKSYQWFIDIMHIDEHGFSRTCLLIKGFYDIIRFWLHRTECVIVCPRLEYGCCVLRLRGGSHLQSPNSIEAWKLHATPLCGSHLQNPYPPILALWGRIIVHICLWGVSMVFMAFGADY